MVDRVLVPLDGSEAAEAILPHLRRFVRRHPAEVILLEILHEVAPDFHFAVPGQSQEVTAYLRKRTFEFIQEGIPARAIVKRGPAVEKILETARLEEASLIALATHGRTGLERMLMGSVAEGVLRQSPVPIFLVRAFPNPTLSRGHLEELPFRRILVPLDGSEASRSILPLVARFARPLDATITLLHVSKPSSPAPHWDPAEKELEATGKFLTDQCLPIQTAIRTGDPSGEILKFLDQEGGDLVFLATHGRSGPSRWILGSVTEEILRHAKVPLIVAHQAKGSPEEPAARSESSAIFPPA